MTVSITLLTQVWRYLRLMCISVFGIIELESVIKSASFKYTAEISQFNQVFLYIEKLPREYSNGIYCEFQF